MPDVIDRISVDLGVERSWIEYALTYAHTNYKKIRIPKRSGGTRVLLQPSVETKMIQGWLLLRILSHLPVSSVATAFEAGTSIVKNAKAHQLSRYSVRVDLTDFFPSIKLQDLLQVIERHRGVIPEWAHLSEIKPLIASVCFSSVQRLPAGYPTSPRIANLVMKEIDEVLLATIASDRDKFGHAVLTRYADDFVFSTDKKGACANFIEALRVCLATTSSPRLRLNEKKTKMMSREGGSTLITGLRVKQDGQVGIHANYRDHVRLLLKLFAAETLDSSELQALKGHLAFIEHADPSLFTKLSYKYSEEIASLRATAISPPSPTSPPPPQSSPHPPSQN